MATGNESPEKMGIYQLPSHIHGTDNKSSKNRSRSNNNNNNTRDVPATSIIIGNDVNTVDDSSLECSLYFDEENGTSIAVAAGNNRSAGNGKKIFRETNNNNNNNNNMNRNVDKVQGVKYQNNITITTTTSPGKQSASSPLPNVKPTAIPATRRETRYRSSNNSSSSSSHDEDPDHHHHPSNNSDTFFFSSLSRFITRQPQANKVVFFTSVFLVLCSLGLAAVGLGLSLQQSGFGGEGGDGGVDVDGGGTSEPQYASLLNNDVPHVSTVDARDVKALLNSTAAGKFMFRVSSILFLFFVMHTF